MWISLCKTRASEWTPKCICESHVDWFKFEDLSNRDQQVCVGSTDRKSDRERLRKIHWSVYRGCEMLAELLHRTRPVFSDVYLTDWYSDRQILTKQAHKTCVYLVLKAWIYYGERHRTHRCKSYVGATKPVTLPIKGSAVHCSLTWFFQLQPAIVTFFTNYTS